LSYYPLSTQQVLQEAFSSASVPIEWLGDLTTAASHYNDCWLTLERSAESTDELRFQIIATLLKEQGISNPAAALAVSRAYGDVRSESGVLPYPGVDRLLTDLKPNYKLGLLTNGPSDIQWEKVAALGFDKQFDAIIVAGDVGIYKPDVRVFEMLLEQLGSNPQHSLFAGDTYDTDIVGALNTGMHTAWIVQDDKTLLRGVRPTLMMTETAALREVLL